METGRFRRKFALKTRKWMEMDLGKRGGMDWIPKICPVKGSSLDPISIRFREDTIREGPTVRNLGVVFDKHLTWDSHVSALVKKCNGILIELSHVRHQIPTDLLCRLWSML